MHTDSITIIEEFFQASFGTEVKAADVAALPTDQLVGLLDNVFDRTCTPFRGAVVNPEPNLPERTDDRWAAAFHTPSSLFSPKRICEEARRLLPMVLYLDQVAIIDPMSAVAHLARDDVWQGLTVGQMLLRRTPPNRVAFERLRRLRVHQATLLLEEINAVRDSIRLVPSANWGTQSAGSAWDWCIQMWAINRAMDVDAGYEPSDERRPDPDLALVHYFRAASVVSLIVGDGRSWKRAVGDAAARGAATDPTRLAELLLAQPARSSGADLQRLLEHDTALADVRSSLSTALEAAARLPSDDATRHVVDTFNQSADRLVRRQRATGTGRIELTTSGLAIGGVVLDFALTGTVAPSAVVGALAAQLPLLHSIHATSNSRLSQESARGALLRLGRPVELSAGIAQLVPGPMTRKTTRALAGRVLGGYAAMCARLAIWPPRIVDSAQVLVDVLLDWLWDELRADESRAVVVTWDQTMFDQAVGIFEGACPIAPHGTWALVVADCVDMMVKQNGGWIHDDPPTFRLERPTWL